jgi:hypothetical protein
MNLPRLSGRIDDFKNDLVGFFVLTGGSKQAWYYRLFAAVGTG